MKRFTRAIQLTNIKIMQDYLRRHSDIDNDSLALMTYRELCAIYENICWIDNMFRLYFNKPYFHCFRIEKKTL